MLPLFMAVLVLYMLRGEKGHHVFLVDMSCCFAAKWVFKLLSVTLYIFERFMSQFSSEGQR